MMKAWFAAVVLHALTITTGWVSYQTTILVNDLVWTAVTALAAISSLRAAVSLQGADRAAWLIFALACTSWFAGQLVWNYYELYIGAALPFPSYADVGYVLFGPFMLLGLFVLRATQQERRLTWLRVANLGLILCSLAMVLITAFRQPFEIAQRSLASSLLVVAENASITLAFIVATYFLWSYDWDKRLLSYSLLTLSLAFQMICGLLYTRELIVDNYGSTSFFNVGWTIAFGLHQMAAEARVARRGDSPDARSSLRQSHGWVEALVPSFLLLCVACSAALLAEEFTVRSIHLGTFALMAFAAVLALREVWMYSHGQQLRSALDSSSHALSRARERLNAVAAQRSDLERLIEVTARAGGVGLWEWDMAANSVKYSREWKRQLGYSEHEISDQFDEWSKRLHPDDKDRITTELQRFLRHPEGEYIAEQRLQHRDGSYRWILSQGCVVLDGTGRPARMLGSHVDITPFKSLEKSLRESEGRYRDLVDALESRVTQRTRELMEAYRESRNFAYAVAHDLKSPLRAISGFCALLEQSAGDRLTAEERGYVTRASQGALRMAALIDDLLNYSRLEHREQRLGPIDCKRFVEQLLGSMAYSINEARAEVSVDLDSTLVIADSEGLRIALSNLIDNALKFSRPGERPRIVIESEVDGDRYILKVRDNGIGFNPAYRDKIFDIFNRLHATGYEGTGIGLALVRKAVHRMDGEVWASAVLGEGATFCVSLRLAEPEAEPLQV